MWEVHVCEKAAVPSQPQCATKVEGDRAERHRVGMGYTKCSVNSILRAPKWRLQEVVLATEEWVWGSCWWQGPTSSGCHFYWMLGRF